jgi:Asp-tRNA(Asn)/Glu-tRNA(Gln) amidotransferase A subunit family amidase
MKPSFGLLPRTGMLKTTDSLDTIGFFARTVQDLGLMFDVMRVHGPDYPMSYAALGDWTRQTKTDRPWRVALVEGPKWADAEGYARKALERWARELGREPELRIEQVQLPESFSRAHDIHATIYDRTLAYYFKEEFKSQTLISPVMYDIIRRGNQLSLDQYKEALAHQDTLAHEFDALMQDYDALLTLSTGGAALKGLDSVDRPDSCLIWTLCGAPAINLPVFVADDGMPFGAQIVGRRYNDLLLLEFAHFLRSAELIPDATNPTPRLAVEEQR